MGGYSQTCPTCGKGFLNFGSLNEHARQAHGHKVSYYPGISRPEHIVPIPPKRSNAEVKRPKKMGPWPPKDMTPTGRLSESQPEIQNLPGSPAHALEMFWARHGMPVELRRKNDGPQAED